MLLILTTLLAAIPLCANALIDPTRPPQKPEAKKSDRVVSIHRGWTLESTLVAPDRRVAVINGKLVSEGESVDGARILKIHKLDVLVQSSGRRIILPLLPDIIKKQP